MPPPYIFNIRAIRNDDYPKDLSNIITEKEFHQAIQELANTPRWNVDYTIDIIALSLGFMIGVAGLLLAIIGTILRKWVMGGIGYALIALGTVVGGLSILHVSKKAAEQRRKENDSMKSRIDILNRRFCDRGIMWRHIVRIADDKYRTVYHQAEIILENPVALPPPPPTETSPLLQFARVY